MSDWLVAVYFSAIQKSMYLAFKWRVISFKTVFQRKIIGFFCEASVYKIQTIVTKKFEKLTVEDKNVETTKYIVFSHLYNHVFRETFWKNQAT